MEAEAESVGILATPDSIESKFQRLEGGVEDELSALKRGMLTASAESRQSTAVAQRPLIDDVLQRTSPVMSEIDAELEALRKKARM